MHNEFGFNRNFYDFCRIKWIAKYWIHCLLLQLSEDKTQNEKGKMERKILNKQKKSSKWFTWDRKRGKGENKNGWTKDTKKSNSRNEISR